MAIRRELAGRIFGRLSVIKWTHKDKFGHYYWECVCQCGNTCIIMGDNIFRGKTTSCGCYVASLIGAATTKHGQTRGGPTKEYTAWCSMIARCCNKNNQDYHAYGGRGIKVCERWLLSFENFFADMGKKPSSNHSLDRYPNNATGNYEPGNCRWATADQQAVNQRKTVKIEYNGEILAVSQWARKMGIDAQKVYKRVKSGLIGKEALFGQPGSI